MITNSNKLKDQLLSKGVKPTLQRMEILAYLVQTKGHLTADEVYRALVKRMPMLSKTTVYNTLNALAEADLAVAISITGSETRFDSTLENHHHFLCERCGKILDIAIACPNCGRDRIEGNLIKEIHGYFKGICKECLVKK